MKLNKRQQLFINVKINCCSIALQLLEDSKYHVKHRKERKEASLFHCQDRRGLGVKTKKLYHLEKQHVKKLKKSGK